MPEPEPEVPAPILEAAEVRAKTARYMDLGPSYTDEDIEALVAEVDESVCEYRGYAPTPREVTEVLEVNGSIIDLEWPLVSEVESVTVNGTVVDSDRYTVNGPTGVITYAGSFSAAYPVTVVYTHGAATVPARLARCTALYVASVFKTEESGVSRDAISQNFDGVTTRYSTPSIADGRPTGWSECDRLLNLLTDRRSVGVR